MPLWLQNTIVLAIVAGALAYIGSTAWRTLAARKGGNCCGGKSCAKADEMKRRMQAAKARASDSATR